VRYLLDTNVLIDLSHGVEPAQSTVRGWLASRAEVALCAVQIAEYFSGLGPIARPSHGAFLRAFAHWDISRRAAVQAGAYRSVFPRMGIQVSTPDALIAAVARVHSATLVTRNARDFPLTDVRIRVL